MNGEEYALLRASKAIYGLKIKVKLLGKTYVIRMGIKVKTPYDYIFLLT